MIVPADREAPEPQQDPPPDPAAPPAGGADVFAFRLVHGLPSWKLEHELLRAARAGEVAHRVLALTPVRRP